MLGKQPVSARTSRDVARIAGVSQATVSRVLNDHRSVDPATRARVRLVLEETGYKPNSAARAMRTRRSGSIGVVVENVTNPFYPELLRALSSELALRDLRMVLWDTEGAGEQSAFEAIEQGLVDGVIFTTATPGAKPLERAIERRAPLVLVNRTVRDLPCSQVEGDNESGGYRVARYFAAAGHRKVALIAGPANASTSRDRGRGFRSGARACGLALPARFVVDGGFAHDGGHAAMLALAAISSPPTAVFCVNDLSALGALDAAASLGIRVPDDLWVVGYDDIRMAAWESFSLTTGHQPLQEMVEASVALLLAQIDGATRLVTHQKFPSSLVIRRTTANVPDPDEFESSRR